MMMARSWLRKEYLLKGAPFAKHRKKIRHIYVEEKTYNDIKRPDRLEQVRRKRS